MTDNHDPCAARERLIAALAFALDAVDRHTADVRHHMNAGRGWSHPATVAARQRLAVVLAEARMLELLTRPAPSGEPLAPLARRGKP